MAPALGSIPDDDTGSFEWRAHEPRPWESSLMASLGLSYSRGVPAARLLAGADLAADDGSSDLVLADPVSLVPGRDEATLTPPEALGLAASDRAALFEAANALLADDAATFVRGASGRWYLRGLDASALATPPTHFLARRESGAWLPGGEAAAPWRRLITEIEMLWHAHPLNAERIARGSPAVNGVWFWGGAPLPAKPSSSPSALLVADDPLALALADHAGVRTMPPSTPATFDEALLAAREHGGAGGDGEPLSLLVVDQGAHHAWLANDAERLERVRGEFIARWVMPTMMAIRDGRVGALTLVGGDEGEMRFVPPRSPAGSLFRSLSWLTRRFTRR